MLAQNLTSAVPVCFLFKYFKVGFISLSDTFEFVVGKQFVAIFDLLFALTIVALIEDRMLPVDGKAAHKQQQLQAIQIHVQIQIHARMYTCVCGCVLRI